MTAVDYETLRWEMAPDAGHTRRHLRAALRQYGPFHAAIPAQIAGLRLSLPADVLALADEAGRQIARLDTEFGDPPWTSALLRSESATSCAIAHLTASAYEVAEAETLRTSTGRAAASIVANTAAVRAAATSADAISAETILALHAAVMTPRRPDSAGRWRTQQVWVGGGMFGPRGADYVAPQHRRIPGAVDDLVRFARRDDLPALARIAIAHAQFETIRPFAEGSGRTGRALVQAVLRSTRSTRRVVVPVSAGLLATSTAQAPALQAYRDGDPALIVETFCAAALLATANARHLLEDLQAIRRRWATTITARRHSTIHRLADLLIARPVFDAELLARELGIRQSDVYRHLTPLTDLGIIDEVTGRRRHRVWRAPQVLEALDGFMARAASGSAPSQGR